MGQWLTHREVGIHDTTILTVNWNTSSKFFGGSCGCVERAPDPAQEGVTWQVGGTTGRPVSLGRMSRGMWGELVSEHWAVGGSGMEVLGSPEQRNDMV